MGKPTKGLFWLIAILMTVSVFAVPVSADIGPKASVRVRFENRGETPCYGTLLSERDSTGPQSAWDGNEDNILNYDLDIDIWRAFAEYEDADGYWFLQIGWNVGETGEIAWTYYPPGRFKILLYYPESDTYAVSGIYERYAFDTYYTVDLADTDAGDVQLRAVRSYDYGTEILSLIARIVITILIEMAVALLFGFRGKRALLLLAAVNTVTQILLNFILNAVNYSEGEWAFVFYYVLLEILVFAAEAVLYCLLMKKWNAKSHGNVYYTAYAFTANGVSFAAGMAAAHLIPGIF